ncbi:MAG: Ig-like domain-containing protein [Oscillospiraceae bacterium]
MRLNKIVSFLMAATLSLTNLNIIKSQAVDYTEDNVLPVIIQYSDIVVSDDGKSQINDRIFGAANSLATELKAAHPSYGIKKRVDSGAVTVTLSGNKPAVLDNTKIISDVIAKLKASGIISSSVDDINGDGKISTYQNSAGRIANELTLICIMSGDWTDEKSVGGTIPNMLISSDALTPNCDIASVRDAFLDRADPIKSTTIIFNPDKNIYLKVGENQTINATVSPNNMKVNWTSSSTDVATVDANGKITAKKIGESTITATEPFSGAKKEVTVFVSQMSGSSITFNAPPSTMQVGKTHSLNTKIIPDYAEQNINYAIEPADTFSVDATTHTLKALKPGKATIVISSANYPGVKTFTVTATKGPQEIIDVADVILTKPNEPIIVKLYKSIDLSTVFKVMPENATEKRLRYRVRDMEIATVNADGELVGEALGKTRVTAYCADDSDKSVTVTLYVTKDGEAPTGEVEVTGVSLERETYNIRINDAVRLNAVVQPYTADNKVLFWETSDPEIAEVDEYGNVWGVGEGIAAITVTTENNGYKAVTRVMVRPYVEDPEKDTYHPKSDPEYDIRAFEKVMDTKKIKRQIDLEDSKKMTIKLGTEFILPAEIIEYIRDNEKIVTFEHTSYKWEVDYRDIPDGEIVQDMNLRVTTNPIYKKDMATLLTEKAKPQYLDFAHEGEMPFKATFMYRTNRSSPAKGYYFYYYNSGLDQLEIADDKLKTDSGRFVEIPMIRGSAYVLTDTKQDSEAMKKYNPQTGK